MTRELLRLESFVALGDSFIEGLNDLLPDGNPLGWPDRFTLQLADQARGVRYADLAVRGRCSTRSSPTSCHWRWPRAPI